MGWAALSASVDRVARARLGGVSVTAGAISFIGGILNRSQEMTAEGHISSDVYELNVPTSLFGGLLFGDPITVDGQSFTVRYQPQPLGGGENCLVYLNGPIAVTGGTRIITQSGLALITQDGRYLVIQ
jgi:hypothetical protein